MCGTKYTETYLSLQSSASVEVQERSGDNKTTDTNDEVVQQVNILAIHLVKKIKLKNVESIGVYPRN